MKVVKWFLFCFCIVSFSQNKQLLYGFDQIPQSNILNPGKPLNNKWYVGLPLISHVHTNVGSSGATLFDIFQDDNRDFSNKLQTALYKMSSDDFFTLNEQVDIFSGGFATGIGDENADYISFGMYQETDAIVYFPRDMAILAFEGNQNHIGRSFDLGQLSARAEVISTFHVGYTKKIDDKLTVGARGKIYSSVFNIHSVRNKGTFVTNNGQNNFLVHDFDLDITVHTSGIASLSGESSKDVAEIGKRFFLGGNLGLGFDVGMTYTIDKQWQFDASLLDIGFIYHSKGIENYEFVGKYTYEGINPLFPESGDGQSAEDYWEEIAEDFENLFDPEPTTTKYTTLRPLKLNSSITYAFGEKLNKECDCLSEDSGYLNALSLQLYAIKRPESPQIALTAAYYRELIEGFNIKATYTADSFSYTNIGLGGTVNLGPINVYFLADNLLKYGNLAKAQSVSLQLGFNYIVR